MLLSAVLDNCNAKLFPITFFRERLIDFGKDERICFEGDGTESRRNWQAAEIDLEEIFGNFPSSRQKKWPGKARPRDGSRRFQPLMLQRIQVEEERVGMGKPPSPESYRFGLIWDLCDRSFKCIISLLSEPQKMRLYSISSIPTAAVLLRPLEMPFISCESNVPLGRSASSLMIVTIQQASQSSEDRTLFSAASARLGSCRVNPVSEPAERQ
jgi:hypothetical protein